MGTRSIKKPFQSGTLLIQMQRLRTCDDKALSVGWCRSRRLLWWATSLLHKLKSSLTIATVLSRDPFKYEEDRQHVVKGLRKAGPPD